MNQEIIEYLSSHGWKKTKYNRDLWAVFVHTIISEPNIDGRLSLIVKGLDSVQVIYSDVPGCSFCDAVCFKIETVDRLKSLLSFINYDILLSPKMASKYTVEQLEETGMIITENY
jgi:hypothetical protein